LVGPVDVGAGEELAVAERYMDPAVGVARPGLEEQDLARRILGEPVGKDATRRAGPDDDVIKTSDGSPFGQ